MLDYIFAVGFILLLGFFILAIVTALLDDTETFRAIDKKIAKFIRGKDDENYSAND